MRDVDNHEQVGIALAGLRARALQVTAAAVSKQLEAVLPEVLRPLHESTHQLHAELLDHVRLNFPSVLPLYSRVQASLDHATAERQLSAGECYTPLVKAAGGEIMALQDSAFTAQLTAVTAAVTDALMDRMQALIFQLGSGTLPRSPRTVAAAFERKASHSLGFPDLREGPPAGAPTSATPVAASTSSDAPPKAKNVSPKHQRSKSASSPSASGTSSVRKKGSAHGAHAAGPELSASGTPMTPLPLTEAPMTTSVDAMVSPRKSSADASVSPRRASVRTKVVRRVVKRRPNGPQERALELEPVIEPLSPEPEPRSKESRHSRHYTDHL